MKMEGVIIVSILQILHFMVKSITHPDTEKLSLTNPVTFLSTFSMQGFDEYMNLVLDQAEEVNTKTGVKRAVGT